MVRHRLRRALVRFGGFDPAAAAAAALASPAASAPSALRFRCSLDRRPFRRCASPRIFKRLRRGRHRIRVRAFDEAGNFDASPARRFFRVRRLRRGR